MIVYAHKNKQTKEIFYIGIGVNESRAYRFSGNSRNQYWRNYVKKHGEPIIEILHHVETREEAAALELMYIEKYKRRIDGGTLVNITIGGDGGALGVKRSKETKDKIGKAHKGRLHTEKAKQSFKAAQNRPEVRAKHAEIKKSEEWLNKQRNAKLGRILTAEHKNKISKGLKGNQMTEETKAKISLSNTGKVRSDEHKKRLSEMRKGKPRNAQAVTAAAESNKKILLNTQTGIFYNGMKEAAESLGINLNTFRAKMAGHSRNNTPFVYS